MTTNNGILRDDICANTFAIDIFNVSFNMSFRQQLECMVVMDSGSGSGHARNLFLTYVIMTCNKCVVNK